MPHRRALTKEVIGRALDCPRLAYWDARRTSRRTPSAERSSAVRIQRHHGRIVGEMARGEFPEGRFVGADRFEQALGKTEAAIRGGEETLFEAAFRADGVAIRTDILTRNGRARGWRLWEVKAGGEVKDGYLVDLAVQTHALEAAGIRAEPGLILIDKERLHGDASYFKRVPCGPRVRRRLPEIRRVIGEIRESLRSPDPPPVELSRRCRDCERRSSCWPSLPERSVFELYQGGGGWRAVEGLLAGGRTDLHSLPPKTRLTRIQKRQLRAILTGAPVVGRGLARALREGTDYPLHFLDFEAVRPPIPRFPGQRPFDMIPFQWSCHVLRERGAPLEHFAFLRADGADPRRGLAEELLARDAGRGSILVYSLFEKEVLRSLAKVFPDLAAGLRSMEERLFDLLEVVRRHYYHPGFDGSFSIKNVLPVLAPGKGYGEMSIRDGMDAVWSYYRLQEEPLSRKARSRIEKDLLDYCELDSLAMHEIYTALLRARPDDADGEGRGKRRP